MAAAPATDPRAAAWEARLRLPVIIAALAVLPLLALSLTRPHGLLHTVEVVGHAVVWSVFFAEIAIMLTVSPDWRAWLRGHHFEVAVVAVSSPLVPTLLAFAPALRLLVLAKVVKTLKLAKVVKTLKLAKVTKLLKLKKTTRLLRGKLHLTPSQGSALAVTSFSLGALTVGYIVTGQSLLAGNAIAQAVAMLALGTVLLIAARPRRG